MGKKYLGFKKSHPIYGDNATKTLRAHQLNLSIALEALHADQHDNIKFSRKNHKEITTLPFSILKLKVNDETRYFAMNNHTLDGSKRTRMRDPEKDPGVGAEGYFKTLREIQVNYDESNQDITSFKWAPIDTTQPLFGIKIAKNISTQENIVSRLNTEEKVTKGLGRTQAKFSLYSYKNEGNKNYLLTEWFARGDLRHYLKSNTVSVNEAEKITQGLLLATDKLHQLGYVHRDIKPGNICIDHTGKIKLIDFGCCKYIGTNSYMSHQGQAGTKAYMAPESLNNTINFTSKQSDAYAIGTTIQQVLKKIDTNNLTASEQKKLNQLETLATKMKAGNMYSRLSVAGACYTLSNNKSYQPKKGSQEEKDYESYRKVEINNWPSYMISELALAGTSIEKKLTEITDRDLHTILDTLSNTQRTRGENETSKSDKQLTVTIATHLLNRNPSSIEKIKKSIGLEKQSSHVNYHRNALHRKLAGSNQTRTRKHLVSLFSKQENQARPSSPKNSN
ncbi:MAG: hypothetical protein DHS20C10_09810 [marine bacterium B5-7]|nr:MAG: hypothetical protein DHS20C10_09810 [marine bacterium B5-7]